MTTRLAIRFVADCDEKRAKGLMFASPLEQDEIALFVFPQSERHAFWNKNVEFPLDLAFLNEHGRVVDLRHLEAQSESSVRPSSPARFVVEAAKGTFERLNVDVGDYLLYEGSNMTVAHLNKKVNANNTYK